MVATSNDLVFLSNGITSIPVKVGGRQVLKVKPGEHYRVVLHQDAPLPLLDNVVARRIGHDLQLVYADGTRVILENYYLECTGPAACDITLPGSNGGTITLSADNAVDPTEARLDGSGLVYVHGSDERLMEIVAAVPAPPSAMTAAESGPGAADSAAEAASPGILGSFAGQGYGGLALLAGGLGIAAAAGGGGSGGGGGGGGGGASSGGGGAPAPAVHQLVTGSISGGPVVPGNDLTVKLYASDGVTLLGTQKVSDSGSFSVDVGSYTGAVIAELQNGGGASDFIDEASGKNVDINANLMSTGVVNNGAVSINMNVLTTLAALKAGAQFGGNSGGAITPASVTANNAAVASAFGLVDLTGTVIASTIDATGAANPAYTPDNLSNAVKYGAMLATLSGVDFINGGKIQSTIDSMLAALAVTGSTGTLSLPFQAVLLAGAAVADANTPGDLEAAFISTLAYDVAGAAAALGPSLAALSHAQLLFLPLAVISALSASQVHTFTGAQMTVFSPAQIAALGPNLAALSDGALSSLDAAQMAFVAAQNLALLSNAQLLDLSSAGIAGVTAGQIDALSPLQIAALGSDISALSGSAMASLEPPQVAAISAPAFAALGNAQLAALTPAQAGAITAGQIDALSPLQIAALGLDVTALSATALASLDAQQLAAIAAPVFAAFSTAQLTVLTGAQLAGATAAQIGVLTQAQIAALSPPQITALGLNITALAPEALAILNPQQLAAIAGGDFAALSNSQLQALTAPQLSGITASQINALSPAQIMILGVNLIDTTQPHVSTIVITGADAIQNHSLNAGDVVHVTVLMSAATSVTGVAGSWPELALNIGGTTVQAGFGSGSGTRALVFDYTILADQNDPDGISIDANSLSLHGATLSNSAGVAAALNFARVADNASYLVDNTAPTVGSVAITAASGMQNGVLNAGDVVSVTLALSEAVLLGATPGNSPQLLLNIGGAVVAATYASGSASPNLVFTYTILASQNDSNGISIDANSLLLNGATLTDFAGNSADLNPPAAPDNALYLVDTTAPAVSSIAFTLGSGIQNNLLNTGDIVSAKVTLSEAVFTGPGAQLALNIGGATVEASYVAGSGSAQLVFAYTILAGQNDANGISIDANSLSVGNGVGTIATLTDAAGNAALLNHPAVPDNGAYLVDTVAPAINSIAITSASGIQNSILNAGDVLAIKVALSEATLVSTSPGNAPQLALNIGGITVQASYVFGSGTSSLVFNYTIAAGQNDANGVSIDANSLFLHGSTLQDAAGNNAVLTSLAVPDNGTYLVDTTPPAILNVALTSATGIDNNTLTVGSVVYSTVTMSEATTGIPQLALNIGGSSVEAGYSSGSGSTSLVFSYTILAGQNDSNGISIDAGSLALFSGTLIDAAGNAAVQSNLAVPDNPGYLVDTSTAAPALAPALAAAATAGNDIAAASNGASGFDSSSLSGAGLTLDLSSLGTPGTPPGRINLNNGNTLNLSLSDVLLQGQTGVTASINTAQPAASPDPGASSAGISLLHQLVVDGNATDTVNSSGWGTSGGTVVNNGHTYAIYNQGNFAQLLIEQTIVTHVL